MTTPQDFTLLDDGTMDTVIECPDGTEYRYSTETAWDYRDSDTGTLNVDAFVRDVVIPDWESRDV